MSEAHPTDAAAGSAGGERRLHPFSWLFVLIANLRPMVLPLIVLLVFNRGDRWEFAGVVVAFVLSLYALVYSMGFRYRLHGDVLSVREGLLNRTERRIPIARIHNIVQRRNPLHRLFGVTELRLESAGGSKPEAVMNVIARAEADRLERVLREGHASPDAAGEEPSTAPDVLHVLRAGDLLRLGIASNRGFVVVVAAWAALAQLDAFGSSNRYGVDPRELPFLRTVIEATQRDASAFFGALGPAAFAMAGLATLAMLWLVLRVFSVAIALFNFYGFRLERQGDRIVSESGLFTRTRAGATPRRVQRVSVRQGFLFACMRRVSIAVTLAGGISNEGQKQARLRWLAPIATVGEGRALLAEVRPEADWVREDWRPLHPRAAWRMFKWPAFAVLIVGGAIAIVNPIALWLWLLLPWLWLDARGRARFGGYAIDASMFMVREGWLARRWDSVRLSDIQAVRVMQTPGDRRQSMARVAVASAGGSELVGAPVEVCYLPYEEAVQLSERLREIASTGAVDPGVAVLL